MHGGGAAHGSQARQRWIRISALLLTGCAALGESLHLAGCTVLTAEQKRANWQSQDRNHEAWIPALALPTDGLLALARARGRAAAT